MKVGWHRKKERKKGRKRERRTEREKERRDIQEPFPRETLKVKVEGIS